MFAPVVAKTSSRSTHFLRPGIELNKEKNCPTLKSEMRQSRPFVDKVIFKAALSALRDGFREYDIKPNQMIVCPNKANGNHPI
jgi:hypothetical protein